VQERIGVKRSGAWGWLGTFCSRRGTTSGSLPVYRAAFEAVCDEQKRLKVKVLGSTDARRLRA
jgi:hypothetical protein